MDIDISTWELIGRLALSLLYGAVLGWERESKRKAAGLRTHMMVGLGSASFTIITLELYRAVLAATDTTSSDPLRLIEGVIAGIGFLGAGSIIQARGRVEGITTAATIWVVGAIGIACGGGYYLMATYIVVLAFIILTFLSFLEKKFFRKSDVE